MSWLVFLHVTAVFAVFYILAPALAWGNTTRSHWTLATVETFTRFSFFLHFAVLLLGMIHLAQPGAVILLYFSWIGAALLRRTPGLLSTADSRRAFLVRLLVVAQEFRLRLWKPRFAFTETSGSWFILFGVFFVVCGWFPAHNLRFMDADSYSRATSLGVLGAGQKWVVDLSVPLLIPLHFFSAASAPAVIACSGPLLAAIFAVGTGFLAWEYTGSRLAAFLGTGFAMLAIVSGLAGGSEPGRAGMSAAYAILALGLAPRKPSCAFMASLVAISISAAFWVWLGIGVTCALLAGCGATLARRMPGALLWRSTAVATAVFSAVLCIHLPAHRKDGPLQYEAAATVCNRVASQFARNTWMVVSPSEELPFLYGRGWHLELIDFIASFTPIQVADRSFRFPYVVRDVFFFVEREPLLPGYSGLSLTARAGLDLTRSFEPSFIAYSTPLGRAALEYRAGELLAAYAGTHSDLETLHSDGRLTVYHVSIKSKP